MALEQLINGQKQMGGLSDRHLFSHSAYVREPEPRVSPGGAALLCPRLRCLSLPG